jgi:hypothetical protein
MRGRVADVTEKATEEYVSMVNARDLQLAQLNMDRGVLHDEAMAALPYWLTRFDLMRQFAWNHGHTHAGGWRPRWKVRSTLLIRDLWVWWVHGTRARTTHTLSPAISPIPRLILWRCVPDHVRALRGAALSAGIVVPHPSHHLACSCPLQLLVGEVSELIADEGDKAEVLVLLDQAVLNINAWSGAQLRACLNEARAKALELELAGTSRYGSAMRALHAKDEEINAALAYWKERLHEVCILLLSSNPFAGCWCPIA